MVDSTIEDNENVGYFYSKVHITVFCKRLLLDKFAATYKVKLPRTSLYHTITSLKQAIKLMIISIFKNNITMASSINDQWNIVFIKDNHYLINN